MYQHSPTSSDCFVRVWQRPAPAQALPVTSRLTGHHAGPQPFTPGRTCGWQRPARCGCAPPRQSCWCCGEHSRGGRSSGSSQRGNKPAGRPAAAACACRGTRHHRACRCASLAHAAAPPQPLNPAPRSPRPRVRLLAHAATPLTPCAPSPQPTAAAGAPSRARSHPPDTVRPVASTRRGRRCAFSRRTSRLCFFLASGYWAGSVPPTCTTLVALSSTWGAGGGQEGGGMGRSGWVGGCVGPPRVLCTRL